MQRAHTVYSPQGTFRSAQLELRLPMDRAVELMTTFLTAARDVELETVDRVRLDEERVVHDPGTVSRLLPPDEMHHRVRNPGTVDGVSVHVLCRLPESHPHKFYDREHHRLLPYPFPPGGRANRLLHRIEPHARLVPLVRMRWSVGLRLRLRELLRVLQVRGRSRERVERGRGGERQAIQPCG